MTESTIVIRWIITIILALIGLATLNFVKEWIQILFKDHSYLIFGLGLTGVSVLNYLKNRASNYFVWDVNQKKQSFKSRLIIQQNLTIIDFVVLGPELVF